jgi:hypothetical protein
MAGVRIGDKYVTPTHARLFFGTHKLCFFSPSENVCDPLVFTSLMHRRQTNVFSSPFQVLGLRLFYTWPFDPNTSHVFRFISAYLIPFQEKKWFLYNFRTTLTTSSFSFHFFLFLSTIGYVFLYVGLKYLIVDLKKSC